MSNSAGRHIPWILLPVYAVWKLLTFILKVTGRIICALMGLALMAAGVAISLSIIGAIVGIPLIAFGFLMTIRALF
jgi:hypothetical protein